MSIEADIGILNLYDAEGRMGLHQDKDEREASIAMGVPVVVSAPFGRRAQPRDDPPLGRRERQLRRRDRISARERRSS